MHVEDQKTHFTEVLYQCCTSPFWATKYRTALGINGPVIGSDGETYGHTGECYRVVRYRFGDTRSIIVVETTVKAEDGDWRVVSEDSKRQEILSKVMEQKYGF